MISEPTPTRFDPAASTGRDGAATRRSRLGGATDDDPTAWIELLTAEADGVFIDLTTEPAGWDSPTVEAVALASQPRTRALTAVEAAEVFLATTGNGKG